jgi:hypothetical protein
MPPGTRIPDHIHRHLTVWISILWGKVVCRRAWQRKLINGPSRLHRIEPGTSHGALTGARGGAFLALERCDQSQRAMATEDFELSPEQPLIRLG